MGGTQQYPLPGLSIIGQVIMEPIFLSEDCLPMTMGVHLFLAHKQSPSFFLYVARSEVDRTTQVFDPPRSDTTKGGSRELAVERSERTVF